MTPHTVASPISDSLDALNLRHTDYITMTSAEVKSLIAEALLLKSVNENLRVCAGVNTGNNTLSQFLIDFDTQKSTSSIFYREIPIRISD